MQEGLMRQQISEKVKILLGLRHLMEVHQRIGLTYKTSLNLRSGFQIKSIQNSQELVLIGCITLYSIREKVIIHQMRTQRVESIVIITMVICLRGRIIALVVARVVTK